MRRTGIRAGVAVTAGVCSVIAAATGICAGVPIAAASRSVAAATGGIRAVIAGAGAAAAAAAGGLTAGTGIRAIRKAAYAERRERHGGHG